MFIITAVLLLLTAALVLGEISERVHIPAVTGEILAGVILGPAILNLIQPDAFLSGFSEIALFFIVLLLGIDEETKTLTENYGKGTLLSVFSFGIPVLIMYIVETEFLGIPYSAALILSIAVGIPSISITSVLIRQYKLTGTSVGRLIVSSVVISDIVGFIVVSVELNPQEFTFKLLGIALLIAVILGIDLFFRANQERVMRFFTRIHAAQSGPKFIFGSIIVFSLLVSFILDSLGITYVLGAFFAGILVSDISLGEDLRSVVIRTFTRMEESFFGPLFFSIAGLDVIVPTLSGLKTIAALLPVTGILGGAMTYYFSRKFTEKGDSGYVVSVLGSRGAVGIVIASIGISNGFLSPDLYTVALFSTVFLSLVVPAVAGRRKKIQAEPQT